MNFYFLGEKVVYLEKRLQILNISLYIIHIKFVFKWFLDSER